MQVFHSLPEAIRSGYQVVERTSSGYLVRTRTLSGWAFALVDVRSRLKA